MSSHAALTLSFCPFTLHCVAVIFRSCTPTSMSFHSFSKLFMPAASLSLPAALVCYYHHEYCVFRLFDVLAALFCVIVSHSTPHYDFIISTHTHHYYYILCLLLFTIALSNSSSFLSYLLSSSTLPIPPLIIILNDLLLCCCRDAHVDIYVYI